MGSRSLAASRESSRTACHPISDSLASGISLASSAMRGSQTSRRWLMQVKAMVGLQVAPTPPKEIDCASSLGSEESFHSAVGVLRAASSRGPGVYSMGIVGSTPSCLSVDGFASWCQV